MRAALSVGVEKEDSLVVFLESGLMPDSVRLWPRKSMDERKSMDLAGLKTRQREYLSDCFLVLLGRPRVN